MTTTHINATRTRGHERPSYPQALRHDHFRLSVLADTMGHKDTTQVGPRAMELELRSRAWPDERTRPTNAHHAPAHRHTTREVAVMATDPRQYARVAVDLSTNRKLKGAPAATRWLAVTGLLWSVQNLSDGLVTPAIICATAEVPIKHANDLVNRDVWHRKGHACPDCRQPDVVTEVVIHDFLNHQDSAETIRRNRDEKAKSGRLANHLRWKHAGPIEECPKCSE